MQADRANLFSVVAMPEMKELTFEETVAENPSESIGEALRSVVRRPSQFVRYWNYKGAILSGVVRAPIFLVTYLIGRESLRMAIGAATVQFFFRFFFAGVGGALIQSLRHVEPAWKAVIAVLMIVPFVSHVFEFAIQYIFGYVTGTQDQTGGAILRSICFSIISALFTIFAMRRGIMIVGDSESKSLFNDISRLPRIIFEFVAFIPNEISSLLRRGAYIGVILAFCAFGIFAQLLCWAFTNKMYWTYGGGKEFTLIKFWGVDGMILMLLAVIISTVYYGTKRKV